MSAFSSTLIGYTPVALVALTRDGDFASMTYLTDCCRASAKGSGSGGVVCRACYTVIDPRMGGVPGLDGYTVTHFATPQVLV